MSQELAEVTGGEFSLANLPEEMQAKIKAAADKLRATSAIKVNKIRLDAKSYIFPDGSEVQSFNGVIVAAKHSNIHYAGDYEEGTINRVDCFAIREVGDDAANKDLTPHSSVIGKYHTNCGDCPKWQWGSDKRKKGKECAEYVLLAVVVPSLGDTMYLLEEKKGNAKVIDGYIRNVTDKFGHPLAVQTQFTMGEEDKWKQSFQVVGGTAQELVTNLAGRITEADQMLTERVLTSYDAGDEPVAKSEEAPPAREARSRK